MIQAYAWIALSFLCVLIYMLWPSSYHRLPPGPKRLPLVGNVLELPPAQYMHLTFATWAKKYGDLIYNKTFGYRMVIINSQKIARDLLEKRGANCSSRPRMTMLVELLGWNPSISALPYKSESYRKHRRWIQSAFGDKDAVKGFLPLKTREMHIFLMSLMERPSDYVLHVKRFVAALAVETVYGHRIESLEDEHVTLMDQAMGATTATGAAGGTLVDLMPFLKYVPAWMPGAAYQRIAARGRQLVSDSHYIPYRKTRESMASEDAPASFMSALIEQATSAGRLDEEETDIIYAAGAIYSAATDTTKTVLLTFILAMVLHPEVYTKLQNEVDRVVGKDRLPSLEDRPDLTYVDCVLKETYRWNPPLPLGLPHYITEDDTYEGYHLPKDTTVLANLWSICREKDMWPGDELDVFRPERFLDLDAEEAKAMDPRQVVFGYGRRLCPGRLFADETLFLVISNMAATLDIRKARDVGGREITPQVSFHPALVSYPEEFLCDIAPRNSAVKSLVAEKLSKLSAY